jgi:hypothetical protein
VAYFRTSGLGVSLAHDPPFQMPPTGWSAECVSEREALGRRGVVTSVEVDGTGIIRYSGRGGSSYDRATATRRGNLRSMTMVGQGKDYPADGPPIQYVTLRDSICVENIDVPVALAVMAGVISQAEVDAVAIATVKTPEELAALTARAKRQKVLTAAEQARADRDAARIQKEEAEHGCAKALTSWVPSWIATRWCAPGGGIKVGLGAVAAVAGVWLVLRWAGGAAGEAGRRMASAREKKA